MYYIAIPSHKRAELLETRTLKMLEYYHIPLNQIYIFVAPEEEQDYKKQLYSYQIIPSALGCIANRAFIRSYFPQDACIVYMDDDIKGFGSVCDTIGQDNHSTCCIYDKDYKDFQEYHKECTLPSLSDFLDYAFKIMKEEGAHFGGPYPIRNGFFAKHNYTTHFTYISGACYFEINDHSFALTGSDYSEDLERCCLWWEKDKKVIRFNMVMTGTSYFKGKGGLVDSRTVEKTREAMFSLHERFPHLLTVIPPSKNCIFWNARTKKIRA